ncbi:secreted protein [Rhizoctonia solani]|nr:secreted protein [Rhizoctonia solani]
MITALSGLPATAPLNFNLPSKRALPTPVSVATAKTYLSELTVAVDSNSPAYSRDLFPTWDTISGTCNTRETVLKRDGTGVVTDTPYDGATWTAASDLDIDHIVPLKEAWVSGARDWTTARREALANDLTRPQLLAVTDNVNQSKGDKDPANWMPPLASYHCIYVRAWITVKYYYGLTVDSAEKAALSSYLSSC